MDVSSSHTTVIAAEFEESKKQIDQLVLYLNKTLNSHVQPISNNAKASSTLANVYHYTTDAGLDGILSSKELWLSDLFTLNDPTELLFGLKIFSEEFSPLISFKGAIADRLNEKLNDIQSPDSLRQTANFFALSLSWHENDLSQWRSYADNGRGFALEFDRSLLDAGAKIDIPKVQSFPICYDDALLKQTLTKIATDAYAGVNSVLASTTLRVASEYAVDQIIRTALLNAIVCSVFFKHSAYINEREVRYLEINNRKDIQLSVRKKYYEISSYRKFRWFKTGKSPLKGIVVGPAGGAKSLQFARDCLRLRAPELSDVDIRESKLPYRV